MKKVYRLIKFNQNAWLKPIIDMKTDLRKKAKKNDFEKNFFKLIINLAFGNLWKIWENIEIFNFSQQKEEETIRCQNQIIILQLFFTENLLEIEMKIFIFIEIILNRSVYLGLSIRALSKTSKNEFCYDYVNPKYGDKAKLCDIDKYCFSVYIKTNDLYKQIAQNAESRLDASNYELDRPLPKGKS